MRKNLKEVKEGALRLSWGRVVTKAERWVGRREDSLRLGGDEV